MCVGVKCHWCSDELRVLSLWRIMGMRRVSRVIALLLLLYLFVTFRVFVLKCSSNHSNMFGLAGRIRVRGRVRILENCNVMRMVILVLMLTELYGLWSWFMGDRLLLW